MLAASKPENQLTSIFSQLSFSTELKDYRMYLVVFLFDRFEDVSSEAIAQAEPLVIYNDSLNKVIDFVFNKKSRIVVKQEQSQTVYFLKETRHCEVNTYCPDSRIELEAISMDEVFHKILVFNYQREE